MLGDFITRLFVLVLGYAYPAFECYKTVEKNRIEIEQLRFWCQYWIIIALLTVTERFGDVFISWLPMYGELKLAFVVYLWHPKTKGTNYIYETFLRPYVAQHENDIDRQLMELRARAWDLFIQYWQNCAVYGQTTFFQVLQFLAAQSARATHNTIDPQKVKAQPSAPPPFDNAAPIQKKQPSLSSSMKLNRSISPPSVANATIQKKPSSPSPSPSSSMKLRRSISQEPKAKTVVMKEHSLDETKAEAIVTEATMVTEVTTTRTTTTEEEEQISSRQDSSPTKVDEPGVDETLRSAMLRLRRSSSRPHQ